MTLYINTGIHDTELTIQSDNEHKLIELLTNNSLRMFLNEDSYIGFHNYLNLNTTNSVTFSMTGKISGLAYTDTIDIFIMNDEINDPYIVTFTKLSEGIKVDKYSTDDRPFLYNRMIRKYSLPLMEV
jgi:hypothetical protein